MTKSKRKAKEPSSAEPEQTLTLPHVRGQDYREHRVDGALSRIEGGSVRLTFFINDAVTTHEIMELSSSEAESATYRSKQAYDENQRTDVVAVRMPLSVFFEMHEHVISRVVPKADDEQE